MKRLRQLIVVNLILCFVFLGLNVISATPPPDRRTVSYNLKPDWTISRCEGKARWYFDRDWVSCYGNVWTTDLWPYSITYAIVRVELDSGCKISYVDAGVFTHSGSPYGGVGASWVEFVYYGYHLTGQGWYFQTAKDDSSSYSSTMRIEFRYQHIMGWSQTKGIYIYNYGQNYYYYHLDKWGQEVPE